jgi:hypothetical protein
MSLAWGSLALLVVLLPGVLFFAGLRIPERFTREAAERSALGQLAGVLLISLVVHGSLYVAVAPVACRYHLPCVDIGQFLTALTIEKAEPSSIQSLAESISRYRGAIFGYLLVVAFAGLGAGLLLGKGIIRFRRLAALGQHTWVNRLTVGDQYTLAWVLTNIRQDHLILIYRGFVQAAHLRKDGTFAYIVLTGVRKYYLNLSDSGAVTQPGPNEIVGVKTRALEQKEITDSRKRFVHSSLVIEGEDIANVMFDRYELNIDPDKISAADFERAVSSVRRQFQVSIGGTMASTGELSVQHIKGKHAQ